jgi:hypothetical protein
MFRFYEHCRPKFHFMVKGERSQQQAFITRQIDFCAGTNGSVATHCNSNKSPPLDPSPKIIYFL